MQKGRYACAVWNFPGINIYRRSDDGLQLDLIKLVRTSTVTDVTHVYVID